MSDAPARPPSFGQLLFVIFVGVNFWLAFWLSPFLVGTPLSFASRVVSAVVETVLFVYVDMAVGSWRTARRQPEQVKGPHR